MSTTTAGASHGTTRNNGGTVLFGGNVPSGAAITQFPDRTIIGHRSGHHGAVVVDGSHTGVESAFRTAAVTITSITEDSGFTLITKSSHGLLVGQKVYVTGTNVPGYNRVHVITSKNTNDFTTDVVFSANTTTHGSYTLKSGDFAKMTASQYIMMRNNGNVAGSANTTLLFGTADFGIKRSIHWKEHYHRWNITSWDYVSGAATYGSNRGTSQNHKNVRGSGNIDDAAHPTRAIPGEFVYTEHGLATSGSLSTATQADYDEKTD